MDFLPGQTTQGANFAPSESCWVGRIEILDLQGESFPNSDCAGDQGVVDSIENQLLDFQACTDNMPTEMHSSWRPFAVIISYQWP